MIYAWLASIGGKALAILAGVLLCMGVLAYIGHVRKENVRLTQTVARLEADAALLQANARLAIRLTQKQTDAREKLEPELEKLRNALLTRKLPKETADCRAHLDLVRDAVRWVQSGKAGGGAGTPAANVPAAAAKLPKGRDCDGRAGTCPVRR
jgi:hypothetical protein